MPKLKLFLLFLLIVLSLQLITPKTFARTTPEDILNAKRQTYNAKVKKYSPENQQKLESLGVKIALVNKSITDDWEKKSLRQGQILDEYIKRNGLQEENQDGIHRNLSNKVENARYWLTYAHEAVAYQAAKIYIFNLTHEKNIKQDSLSQINELNSDLNALKSKVQKSQQIIESLVTNWIKF